MLEVAGVEGFLANTDAMFEQADSDAVQWESFLLTLAELFDGEPFRVTDVAQRLEARALLGGNAESKGLREALPDFLAEAERSGVWDGNWWSCAVGTECNVRLVEAQRHVSAVPGSRLSFRAVPV
jgi:hypothetical protein